MNIGGLILLIAMVSVLSVSLWFAEDGEAHPDQNGDKVVTIADIVAVVDAFGGSSPLLTYIVVQSEVGPTTQAIAGCDAGDDIAGGGFGAFTAAVNQSFPTKGIPPTTVDRWFVGTMVPVDALDAWAVCIDNVPFRSPS